MARTMIPYTIYATPEQLSEMTVHAGRLRIPVAAIIRTAMSKANAELRAVELPGQLPQEYRETISANSRSAVPRRRAPARGKMAV
jgi:hypothetical protein